MFSSSNDSQIVAEILPKTWPVNFPNLTQPTQPPLCVEDSNAFTSLTTSYSDYVSALRTLLRQITRDTEPLVPFINSLSETLSVLVPELPRLHRLVHKVALSQLSLALIKCRAKDS